MGDVMNRSTRTGLVVLLLLVAVFFGSIAWAVNASSSASHYRGLAEQRAKEIDTSRKALTSAEETASMLLEERDGQGGLRSQIASLNAQVETMTADIAHRDESYDKAMDKIKSLNETISALRKSLSDASVSRSGGSGGWSSARVSWYGPGFYGRTMAGGGKLQTDSMVVAHRTMAFGTRIQFSYNGRTCTAVVQDRGPYVGGRTFDLGPGTAKALGFSGVGTVKYRVVS